MARAHGRGGLGWGWCTASTLGLFVKCVWEILDEDRGHGEDLRHPHMRIKRLFLSGSVCMTDRLRKRTTSRVLFGQGVYSIMIRGVVLGMRGV